mmetsp:Transcript_16916/g.28641  ORF Transcript_16916/g.28641 Transcript_16916/m.28641 type:complete len:132 (+) Transcript_16916:588-983(+)
MKNVKVEDKEYQGIEVNNKAEARLFQFEPTPPISTYILNLCAGQFEKVENAKKDAAVPMSIYMRKSKAANIDCQALFGVIESGMRFYEDFTGVKYPFCKYDHIFCPEFRISAMENVGAVTFTDRILVPKEE